MINSRHSIIDAHVHVRPNRRQDIADIVNMLEDAGYRAINMLGMTSFNPEYGANNLSCLLLKKQFPGKVYAFGSLHYPDNGVDPDADPKAYAQFLMEAGFDGIKMLEGKPAVRRRTDIPLNDKYYDSFYDWLEENSIPILFHVNDPANFWDRDTVPPLAVERGDFYGDGTCPSKEEIYGEAEAILKAHPNLKVIWAHFYFLSEEFERAGSFLDTWPNSLFDITPGPEMFFDFSQNPKKWKGFFEKYHDRIIFGTDNYNPQWKNRVNGMTEFLETDNPAIPFFGKTIHGIALSDAILKDIYVNNFMRFMNDRTPQPVNLSMWEEECALVKKIAFRSIHKTVILEELAGLKEMMQSL